MCQTCFVINRELSHSWKTYVLTFVSRILNYREANNIKSNISLVSSNEEAMDFETNLINTAFHVSPSKG